MQNMTERTMNERGSVMVLVLGVLAVLAALAVIAVSIVSSDKWTAFSEYTHSRAFYSADAASEAGINWIRLQATPPPVVDGQNHVRVAGGFTALTGDHSYKSDIQYVRKHFRPGWSVEYKDYEYVIEADGASAKQSAAAVDVRAMRLYREGY
jgi:Tfp pilus assembly protein PilX